MAIDQDNEWVLVKKKKNALSSQQHDQDNVF